MLSFVLSKFEKIPAEQSIIEEHHMEKTGTIIFTFDNILFDTDYQLYLLLMQTPSFSQYIPAQPIKTLVEFNNRKSTNFLPDIMYERYRGNTNVEMEIMLSLYEYAKKHNIYSGNKPTKLAAGTLANPYYIDNIETKEIYIIVPEGRKQQITEYIHSFCVNMKKVKFIYKKPKEKIHDLISNINRSLLVTNETKEIQYLAEKTNIDGKEFMMPKVPYLNIERKVKILIMEKGGHLNFYVPEEIDKK